MPTEVHEDVKRPLGSYGTIRKATYNWKRNMISVSSSTHYIKDNTLTPICCMNLFKFFSLADGSPSHTGRSNSSTRALAEAAFMANRAARSVGKSVDSSPFGLRRGCSASVRWLDRSKPLALRASLQWKMNHGKNFPDVFNVRVEQIQSYSGNL